MLRAPKLIEMTPLPGGGRSASTLAALTFRRPISHDSLAVNGKPPGLVLGIYTTDDSHGG